MFVYLVILNLIFRFHHQNQNNQKVAMKGVTLLKAMLAKQKLVQSVAESLVFLFCWLQLFSFSNTKRKRAEVPKKQLIILIHQLVEVTNWII